MQEDNRFKDSMSEKGLRGALEDEEFWYEWPQSFRSWIPICRIETILSRQQVSQELAQCSRERSTDSIRKDTELICSRGRRLLTILLCKIPEKRQALELLLKLLKEGVSDADLPFARVPLSIPFGPQDHYSLGRRKHVQCLYNERCGCSIKSLADLPWPTAKSLDTFQWHATAPVFKSKSQKIVHYTMENGTILPFVEDPIQSFGIAGGGYGEVRAVRVHPSHQNLVESDSDPKGPIIAIKALHERDPEAFRREVEMLKPLTIRCNHPHIIKLLATYQYQSKYHLMFPFARENLRSFWKSYEKMHWNHGTLLWMIEQLVGLASGLDTIHEFKTGRTTTFPPELPNREATVSRPSREGQLLGIKAGEEKFGRHGDIKPENILVMGQGANSLGTLQLADMGLSRFHRLDSRSKVDPLTVNGSATYVPPELALKVMVNRKYDIWSLGCVFLEFITWTLGGFNLLEEFPDARQETAYDGFKDDTFFNIEGSAPEVRAILRPKVKEWIDRLGKSDTCTLALKALLEIVEKDMLNVNVKARISAKDLHLKLEEILARSKSDVSYLWK